MHAILLAVAQPAESAPAPAHDCSYDLEAMLALDRKAFDQTLPDGGWRSLYERGCYAEAAELIRAWRHEKRDHASILYTHEGMMRAYAGQTEEAITLLRLTYKPMDEDVNFGWNFYMDGTIAFLKRDRGALDTAIARLQVVPQPQNLPRLVDPLGKPVEIVWPPNMNVLRAFEKCWDKTYRVVFEPECITPFAK
jgi:hypothetical protein